MVLLTIYDKAGTGVGCGQNDKVGRKARKCRGDNVLSLSFSCYAFLPLDVNDYTDYLGERYWLKQNATRRAGERW